ncbi:MAG: hypothetical protein IJA41_03940 [Clostridia bacterium]|nr:hypothetical protein [Clostridia bacterium]
MSYENRSPEMTELPKLQPVPNDAVTKMTDSKLFSAARILAIVSAVAFSPIAAIVGMMLLTVAFSAVSKWNGVDWQNVLSLVVVICIFARAMTEAVGAAFGLRRVDISYQVGLSERKASLKALSRVGTAVAVLQWIIFGLLVCVIAWDCHEDLTARFPKEVDLGMIATMLSLCLVHTVALQMTAVGAKHYFNGTEDKKNSTVCAAGLIISGLFELGNVIFVVINAIISDVAKYLFASEVLAAPFFVMVAFVAHGTSLSILGILMLTKCRKKETFEPSAEAVEDT